VSQREPASSCLRETCLYLPFSFAQRARCAAAILSRAAAESVRFAFAARLPTSFPKAARASSSRSTSAWARFFSFFNSLTMCRKLVMGVPLYSNCRARFYTRMPPPVGFTMLRHGADGSNKVSS